MSEQHSQEEMLELMENVAVAAIATSAGESLRIRMMHYASSFDLVPANALTVTVHLATGLLLTLGFVWKMLSAQGLGYMVILGIISVGFVIFMYRYVERQKNIFLGLKQAIS